MRDKVTIGVDIGGTTVKHAIIREDGEMITNWEIPTRLDHKGAQVPHDIWSSIQDQLVQQNIDKRDIIGIGVGAPGFIDPETGIVTIAVNIGWENYDLKQILQDLSGVSVFVENDANVAALGENWKGAGNQVHNMIAVTLGTGVGGGIISNHTIINGANGTGGEIGHITVEKDGASCNCGRKGCLETVASATGIVRQAKEMIDSGVKTDIVNQVNDEASITTKDIFEVAKTGDQAMNELLDHVIDVLGFALAGVAMTTNPAKIVIGGGVSKAGDQLLQPLKKKFESYCLPRTTHACEFVLAQLENDAGVYGAAYMVLQQMKRK
ncbi:glucose kinase [Gracilibacillus halophilus YIM-C55.5]|uniref:Glucokinase n=1 Tax=Gracilibacillus halophilus YIM-C55.5 TaxID=1308866 RepID=N4WMU2_9BACI|nr:ROK family glucokinase [Gracilibacillus halophilus]ENH97467.1 glucose kinase [Gracilibacillus halophilus YIM-C55.5]